MRNTICGSDLFGQEFGVCIQRGVVHKAIGCLPKIPLEVGINWSMRVVMSASRGVLIGAIL